MKQESILSMFGPRATAVRIAYPRYCHITDAIMGEWYKWYPADVAAQMLRVDDSYDYAEVRVAEIRREPGLEGLVVAWLARQRRELDALLASYRAEYTASLPDRGF